MTWDDTEVIEFLRYFEGFDLHALVVHVVMVARLTQRFESQVPSRLRRVAVTLITYRCLHMFTLGYR